MYLAICLDSSLNTDARAGPDRPLVGDIDSGSEITILGQPSAGSTVGYLYNTLLLNPGYLNVTVEAVPEPSTTGFLAGLLSLLCLIQIKEFRPKT